MKQDVSDSNNNNNNNDNDDNNNTNYYYYSNNNTNNNNDNNLICLSTKTPTPPYCNVISQPTHLHIENGHNFCEQVNSFNTHPGERCCEKVMKHNSYCYTDALKTKAE